MINHNKLNSSYNKLKSSKIGKSGIDATKDAEWRNRGAIDREGTAEREGAAKRGGRRPADGRDGDYGLALVPRGEPAMPEDRQVLASQARGLGGLPKATRTLDHAGGAAALLLAGARQHPRDRPGPRHFAPPRRRLLPGRRGAGRVVGEILRRRRHLRRRAAYPVRGKRPGRGAVGAGGAFPHEA